MTNSDFSDQKMVLALTVLLVNFPQLSYSDFAQMNSPSPSSPCALMYTISADLCTFSFSLFLCLSLLTISFCASVDE